MTATTNRRGRLAALAGLAAALAATLPGCGAAAGDLTGTVTHKGKAVTSGSVTAVGSDGLPRGAAIGTDGKYALTGLPVGEVKITVSSPNPATLGQGGRGGGRDAGRGKEGRQPPGAAEPVPAPDADLAKKWFPIPEHYGDLAKTPLRATVKKGHTPHDIDLP